MPVFVSDPTSETKWMGGNYKGRSLVTPALDLLLIGWWLWYSVSLAAVIVLVPSQCLLSLQVFRLHNVWRKRRRKLDLLLIEISPWIRQDWVQVPLSQIQKGKRVFGLWTVTKILWKMRPWEFSDSPESKLELTKFGLDLLKYGISKKNETNVYLNKS